MEQQIQRPWQVDVFDGAKGCYIGMNKGEEKENREDVFFYSRWDGI